MLPIIAGAAEGEWIDMPEGTLIQGEAVGTMDVARIRRVNGDLDVETRSGRVWRFTEIGFSSMSRTIANGNTITERPIVSWTKVEG